MAEQQTMIAGPDGKPVELSPEQLAAVEEEAARVKAERADRLDALGASLAKKRKEAIEYRRSTGIEKEWDEDEDAYEGVDEVSKTEQSAFRTRPPGQLMLRDEGDEMRSTVVLNITKPYVNAFASKIIDMRLQINNRSWAFKPTPLPELTEAVKNQKHLGLTKNNEPVMVMEDGQQRQATMADMAKRDLEKATKAAEGAQKQVDDWMVESCWDSEARQALDDMARMGTGVLKGPFPQKCVYVSYVNGQLAKTEKIKPWSKRINARNLYPDPACGEDIHNGDYIWEQDDLTAKRLRELIGLPGYLEDQIKAAIEEGPRLPEVEHDPNRPVDPSQKSRPFQIWYYTGSLDKDDIEAAGCDCGNETPEPVPVIVAMVNDHVIRASRNPLDNGKFPYDVAPCSRRQGHWAGISISRELRTPQQMATGGVRAMMENAGLSAKPILALMQGLLVPSDGNNVLYGGKMFIIPKGTDVKEAKDAIFSFQIESRQQECMNIIQFALKMAEDVTGLPMILQGQQGKAPDILGVVQILNENATSVARRVAKMYDDNLLEPHLSRYYDWLMQYAEDDSIKGDYTIDVLPPPEVMVDKAALTELAKVGQVPGSRVDPAKQFAEFAKSNRFDPARIQYTDDEWAKIQKQPQPGDPRVDVAKINAEADARIEAARQKFDGQLEAQRQQFEGQQAELDRQLASAELSSEERRDLEKQKVLLSSLAIKLNVQQKMARDDQLLGLHKHTHPSPQVVMPAVEPAGKAKPGQAFTH